jgi:hypothetical protein
MLQQSNKALEMNGHSLLKAKTIYFFSLYLSFEIPHEDNYTPPLGGKKKPFSSFFKQRNPEEKNNTSTSSFIF